MTICPHCGKEVHENAVKHWRENLVHIPNRKTQVESIGNLQAAVKDRCGNIYHSKRGSVNSPVLVVISDVEAE